MIKMIGSYMVCKWEPAQSPVYQMLFLPTVDNWE